MFENRIPKMGEIYYMRFDGKDSEQHGWRPGLVIQNNIGNANSPNIIALPLTTSLKKLDMPTHVLIKKEDTGLKHDSIVLCENPEKMSKRKLSDFITTLPDYYMKDIASAYLMATSALAYLDKDSLMEVWEHAININGVA